MKIDVRDPVIVRRVAEANATPRAGRSRCAKKLDTPLRVAFGKQASLDEQPSLRPETNRRAGIDRQRDVRRHNQRLDHEQRPRRRPAGGACQPLAKRAGGRVAMPDVGVLPGDLVAIGVQRAYEQPVQSAPQCDLGLPPRFRCKPVGRLAVGLDCDRCGGRRLAGQSRRRVIGKKEAVALGQAGGDGQLSRDLRQYKLTPLGTERLQPIDLGGRQIIADEPVDHRLKLLRRKHRLGEVFQVKPIPHGHRRAAHQLGKSRVGGSAPKRALRPALRAEHGVEVVRDQHGSLVGCAGVQRVVALVAGDEARLLVAQQIVHGEVQHPRVNVHPVGQRRLVHLAKRAEEFDQVGVVILPRIGLLGIKIFFSVRRGLVAEKFQVGVATALVKIAAVVVRELPADVLRVQRIQLGVVSELACAAEPLVILKHAHSPGSRRGQTGEAKQRAAEFLRMRMDGVEIDRRVTAPRPVVGEVYAPTLVR